jgi:hypothetical protein
LGVNFPSSLTLNRNINSFSLLNFISQKVEIILLYSHFSCWSS